eukprot:TRINITY_DN5190_c0_g1_i8.p1 TRINITY_DN5190_c0_g1~~TRINITY_DN5190_c0_g1_i8.p1  ORF type:complete len:378 (-),score=34.55 TRINITY_DN5190_c0_g1_i8:141-1181(-)
MGHDVQVSNLFSRIHVPFNLLHVEDGTTITDDVTCGAWVIRHGRWELDSVRIHKHAFVGNNAVLEAGAVVPESSLVATSTLLQAQDRFHAGSTLFGVPAFPMPKSEAVGSSSGWPAFWDSLTDIVLLIVMAFLSGLSIMILFVLPLVLPHTINIGLFSLPLVLILFPAELILLDLLLLVMSLFFKLLLIGRFKEEVCAYGTFHSFRRALVVSMPNTLHMLPVLTTDTPCMRWLHRLFGVHVGHNVLFRGCIIQVTDFDLGTIGDHTVIEPYSFLQTHTSENRMFKFAPVKVGSHCVVGCGSIVMPYQHLDHHVEFRPATCGLPAEYFPPHTTWAGVPPTLVGQAAV